MKRTSYGAGTWRKAGVLDAVQEFTHCLCGDGAMSFKIPFILFRNAFLLFGSVGQNKPAVLPEGLSNYI
jgi:hypothetical protein